MRIANLHPAYVFDCEECGKENLIRCVRPSFSNEELEELKEELSSIGEEGEFLLVPSEAICKNCGTKYSTVPD